MFQHLHQLWRNRPKPSLALLIAMLAIVGLTSLACALLGLSHVRIFVALIALYVAMGSFNGTLAADLRIALLFCMTIVVFVNGVLVAADWSPIAGVACLLVAIWLCSIIHALGSRYAQVRLGMGLVTLYAYAFHLTRAVPRADLVEGSFVALATIVVLRLLAALPGADASLRRAIAKILADPSRAAMEDGASAWLAGPSRVWSGRCLIGAVQYRAALWSIARQNDDPLQTELCQRLLADLDEVSSTLAACLRARRPNATALLESLELLDAVEAKLASLEQSRRVSLVLAISGLRQVVKALHAPDRKAVEAAAAIRRAVVWASLRAAVTSESDHMRNGLRAVVTVAISLLAIHVAGQPTFALPLLMGAYGVLQPTIGGSVAEGRRRIGGVLVGAGAATVVSATAAPQVATAFSLFALILAFAYIASSIPVFMGGLVATLSISVAPMLHMKPASYALGYVCAVAMGAAIATGVGFRSIRPVSGEAWMRRLHRAMEATADALDAFRGDTRDIQKCRLLSAFAHHPNAESLPVVQDQISYQDAADALKALNLLALALTSGVAARSVLVDQTVADVASGLRAKAVAALPARVLHVEGSGFDVADVFLRTEYSRLRVAVGHAA
jgi:hypothetical protein